jgi:hypothetical protein
MYFILFYIIFLTIEQQRNNLKKRPIRCDARIRMVSKWQKSKFFLLLILPHRPEEEEKSETHQYIQHMTKE